MPNYQNGRPQRPGQKPTFKQKLANFSRNYSRLDKKDKMLFMALGASVLVVVIIVLVLVVLLSKNEPVGNELSFDKPILTDSSGSVDLSADKNYAQNKFAIDLEEYKDTILQETTNTSIKQYLSETLFLGDSNTVGYASFGHMAYTNAIGIPSMGVQSIASTPVVYFYGFEQGFTMPQAAAMIQPRRIYFFFGTNNTVGMSAKDFTNTYSKNIKAVEKAYPYADIIVCAIPPVAAVRDYKNVTMQSIDELNLATVKMCETEGWKYLNTSEILKDKTGFLKKSYCIADGLHINAAAYEAIMDYVKEHTYVTKDTRPTVKNVPQRRPAPLPPASSDEMSSSMMMSSMVSSSYAFSSSIPVISSSVPSSQVPSSVAIPSSVAVPSSVVQTPSSVDATPSPAVSQGGQEASSHEPPPPSQNNDNSSDNGENGPHPSAAASAGA